MIQFSELSLRIYYIGTSVADPKSSIRIENKAVDDACSRYEKQVNEIVK